MGAVRGYRHNGRQTGKEQNAIRARVIDAGKLLQYPADLLDRASESGSQIARKFILHTGGNLQQTLSPQFRNHATGLQRARELCHAGLQDMVRFDADLFVERFPPPDAGQIARRISAVPPDQEVIGIGWPTRRLVPIHRFQDVEDGGDS